MTKKIKEVCDKKPVETDGFIKELLKDIDAMAGSQVETIEWVTTGIPSLNFLLSGNTEKGLPGGKITVVAGEQQTGKSLLGGRIAANAQKQGYVVAWFDTEMATDKKFMKRVGLIPENVIYKRVRKAEDLQIYAMKLLRKIKEKGKKLFIVLDSLGNLQGSKEASDADKDKMVADMGSRAKNVRSALGQILMALGGRDILYVVNHLIINPNTFFPVAEMRGGKAPYYLGQIILFLSKINSKSVEGESAYLKIKAKKNREFLEGRMCELNINFRNGINENDGLIDLFEEFGLIKNVKGWYKILDENGEEKNVRESEVLINEKLKQELFKKLKEATKNINYYTFED